MAAARVERCSPQLKVCCKDEKRLCATSDLTSQSAPGRSRAHRPTGSGSFLCSCWLDLWSVQPRATLFFKGRSLWVVRRRLAFLRRHSSSAGAQLLGRARSCASLRTAHVTYWTGWNSERSRAWPIWAARRTEGSRAQSRARALFTVNLRGGEGVIGATPF